MEVVELFPTRCAICDTKDNATELYPANFNPQAFNPMVFSARRLPDRIHYRMVRCRACGLVRSDPIADPVVLARLYSQSTFDYAAEVTNLKRTYGRYLTELASEYGAKKGALLEIGCGNGFFLEEALTQGYMAVQGVEPSAAAVAQASPSVRPHLICDVMRPGLFEAEQFDVSCLFQVLDHIPNPGALLDECRRVLKPGALLLCLNHDVESLSARLLKDRSPIVDIEHTYLYSPATISRLLTKHNLQVRKVGAARNTYSLYYLARLVPLPLALKRTVLSFLALSPLRRIRLSVPLGNLYLVAQKPNLDSQ